jgi:hypothetical protein
LDRPLAHKQFTGGAVMPRITFRGKTYYSEFEMPPNIRWAYQKEQLHRASTKSLTDVVDMPVEVEDVYRRALDREEQSSPSTDELPTTDELYRQSAPSDMMHLPSDESVYRPYPPLIDPEYSTIEPESSLVLRGLVFGILWSLVLIAIVFLVIELFRLIL